VLWVRGNFSGGPGHIFLCVCDSAVWSAGPVQFYSGTLLERMAGLYRFFPFLCSGYGTVEMVRGGGLSFFSLSSVCCQFSWWLDVRGRILCSIDRFSSVEFVVFSCGFLFYELLIFLYLLQVVQAE
jgi:hypothetical protein